jgi:hypothetical protein
MRAVLLFSAVLHLAAIGALAAIALRSWLSANRPKEPTVPEYVAAAATLGLSVTLVCTLLSWLGRDFGPSFTTGLAAGLIAALTFMLTLGTLRPATAEPPSTYARLSAIGLVGALVLTEVVAFCFLIASASRVAPFS